MSKLFSERGKSSARVGLGQRERPTLAAASELDEPISHPLAPAKCSAPAQKIPKTALKKRALAVTVRHDVGKPLLYAPTGGRAALGRLRDHPRSGRDPGGLHPSGNQRGLRNFFGVEIFRPEHRGPETWLPLAVADFS